MPERPGRPSRTVALFLAANVLYWISLYLYVPTLPTYVGRRTSDLALVGLVLSMYGLWQALARLPVGIAVDATGRGKPFIVGGFLLAAAGAAAMSASRSVAALAAGRSLTGLAAATWVPLVAIFSGLFPPERAVLAASLLNLTGSIGRMVATSLTGVLNEAGGYGLAFALAAAASAAAIVVVLVTPIERRAPRRIALASVLALARRRDVLLPSALQTVLVFGEWAVVPELHPAVRRVVRGRRHRQEPSRHRGDGVQHGGERGEHVARAARAARHAREPRLRDPGLRASRPPRPHPRSRRCSPPARWSRRPTGIGYPTLVGLTLRRVDQAERSTAAGMHQSLYAVGMFGGPWLGGLIAAAAGLRVMFAVVAAIVLAASWVLTRMLAATMRAAAARSAVQR